MTFKHQVLEVVASSVLFDVTNLNQTVLPDFQRMFLSLDKESVVLTLLACWPMIWHICRPKLPSLRHFGKVTQFLPDKTFTMFFGFISKVIMGLMGLEMRLSVEVLKHLMITPIILHASYSIYHPNCFTQLRTIFVSSLSATLLSVVIVTVFLSQVYAPWLDPALSVLDSLVFASVISAVGKLSHQT